MPINSVNVMSDKNSTPSISDQQLLRAARSFEAIMLSQIEIQSKLGDDLKHAIRFGMIILGLIALSILILLLTMSSQLNRISNVVADMNRNFTIITQEMDVMSQSIDHMLEQVALMDNMKLQTQIMNQEMVSVTADMESMQASIASMTQQVGSVSQSVNHMARTIVQMDDQVQMMAQDMRHMAKPARTINKFFPFF